MRTIQLVNKCALPLRNVAVTNPTNVASSRMLSASATDAVTKLRSAIEQYRVQNYSEELPSRCKKDFIYAADHYHNGIITIEGLSQTLSNIGAENKISREEIKTIMEELGDPSSRPQEQTITVETMLKIL